MANRSIDPQVVMEPAITLRLRLRPMRVILRCQRNVMREQAIELSDANPCGTELLAIKSPLVGARYFANRLQIATQSAHKN